jgi:hypothetical protein
MSMHNSGGHKHDEEMQLGSHGPEDVDASAGFEQSDVRVTGIVVFLAALGIFVVVTAVLCYGMGKVINAHMDKEDGPNTRWTTTADIRQLGNLANNPAMQNKVAQLAQQFPSPRLQEDDGNQEIADIHAREDLLLDNYSWADPAHDKVRIPIEQAMALLAERGLPVAPAVDQANLMTGDVKPVVKAPLTNGFARTGYEQEQAQSEAVEDARGKHR